MKNQAFAFQVTDYDLTKIKEAVTAIMDHPENRDLWYVGKKVLLKANLLTTRHPSASVTVHPIFLRALIEVFEGKGMIVTVADSPAGEYTRSRLEEVYKACQMYEAVEATEAILNEDLSYRKVKSPKGKTYPIISAAIDADMVIDVAKLKTHSYAVFTGAVKNMFGIIAGTEKIKCHARYISPEAFASMLIDICETIVPSFCFIDGIVGMEGNGPSNGDSFRANVILAAKSPHVCDMAALSLAGISYRRVPTASLGVKRGLCEEFTEIESFGKSKKELSFCMRLSDNQENRNWIAGLMWPIGKFFAPYPKINAKLCVGCGKCEESCPKETITRKGNLAFVERKKCIKCYCCQEICPYRAIDFKNK